MELIDIGANLTHDSFDHDRDALIARARAAGVISMIVTGSSAEASADAARLAREYPGYLYATAGVHPHHAKDYRDSDKSLLTDLLQHPEVVAVGECGLDYFRNFSPPDVQREVFREQLEIAADNDMPVFLHQRDAHEDFVSALRRVIWTVFPARSHIASPVTKMNYANIWSLDSMSESPAGFVTSAAAATCVTSSN